MTEEETDLTTTELPASVSNNNEDDDGPDDEAQQLCKAVSGFCKYFKKLYRNKYHWELFKSITFFALALKLAKECRGISIPPLEASIGCTCGCSE